MDNGKEFLVIDVIVLLGGDEQLREVEAGMPVAIRVSLEKDGTGSILQGIGGNGKGFGEIGEV